jgi:hypothetical protein
MRLSEGLFMGGHGAMLSRKGATILALSRENLASPSGGRPDAG